MRILIAMAALLVTAGACSAIPADPDDTLERVSGQTLWVGVSPNPPWTDLPEGTDGAPTGPEVDLVTDFAASLDAEVQWVTGGEEELIGQLVAGELQIVIGGLTGNSPWQEQVALTVPHTGAGGEQVPRVLAVPMGENAFLVALERFVLERR